MRKFKRYDFLILIAALSLSACTSTKNITFESTDQIKNMSLREKVGQLFVIRPESIDTTISLEELHSQYGRGITELSPEIIEYYKDYPAGGFAIFGRNITNPEQIKNLNNQLHNLNKTKPLIFIDEEGGICSRIAENKAFNVPKYKNMAEIGSTLNPQKAYDVGNVIGNYLKEYGFDVNFAPIADVNTNPKNPIIGTRAFSNSPEIAAKMDIAFLEGLHKNEIYGCLKHFPGHGDTKTDTHNGYAETLKDWDQLKKCEMITFQAGIDSGVQLIMTAHIAAPNVTGNSEPATLSSIMLTEKLRKEMGFNGIIITDALEMGAIRKQYSSSEAAIKALEAGADILLMPYDYKAAFEGVIKAVESGRISEERINESVRRVLKLKTSL